MKNIITAIFLLLAGFASLAQACTPSAVAVSPAMTDRTVVSGTGQVAFALTISFDCSGDGVFGVSATSSSFSSQIGSSGFNAQGVFYKDAALTQPLISTPATGSTVAGTNSVVIYGVVNGTAGQFQGVGTYSLPMNLTVSDINFQNGNSSFSLSHIETGTVQGTCAINNATADFGNFASTTAHPIQPVSLTLNCSSGLPWSMSQPNIAVVSIGSTTTNTGRLYQDAGATLPLNTNPVGGTGTGAGQAVNLYAGLSGATISSPITGNGEVIGSIGFVVTY